MKRFLGILLAMIILLTSVAGAVADVSKIVVLGSDATEELGTMNVRVRILATDSEYNTEVDPESISVILNGVDCGTAKDVTNTEGISYIFVIDTSNYYRGVDYKWGLNALSRIASGMRTQDNACFVIGNRNNVIRQGYFGQQDTIDYITTKLNKQFEDEDTRLKRQVKSAIWTLIDEGIREATDAKSVANDQRIVVILTDALDSGRENDKKASDPKATLGRRHGVPVFAFVPYGESDKSIIGDIAEGIDGLNQLTRESDGQCYQIQSVEEGNQRANDVLKYADSILTVKTDIRNASSDGGDKDYQLVVIHNDGKKKVEDKGVARVNLSAVPTPEPVVEDERLMYTWDELKELPAVIDQMESALVENYYLAEAGGELDAKMKKAIFAFCDQNDVDKLDIGISKQAYAKLVERPETIVAKPTATPEPVVTRDPAIIFAYDDLEGNKIGNIQAAQMALENLYYLEVGKYSYGVLDEATQRALNEFCADNGFAYSDGISDQAYKQLINGMNKSKETPTATPSPTPEPTDTPTPEPTPEPTMKPGLVLEYGFINNNPGIVTSIQNRLHALQYLEETSGEYDHKTQMALLDFCNKNNITSSNDGVTQEIYEALFREDAVPFKIATETPVVIVARDMTMGDDGQDVVELQARLVDLGYMESEYSRGMFDGATAAAVKRFCEVNGIEYTGLTTVTIQDAVKENGAKPNEERPLLEKVKIFLTGNMELAGFVLPAWAVVAAGFVLIVAALIVVILLIKSGKKNPKASAPKGLNGLNLNVTPGANIKAMNERSSSSFSSTSSASVVVPGVNTGSEETQYVNDSIDPPTTVNDATRNMTLRIDYNGSSQDRAYTIEDNVQLTIGRGTQADIQLDKDDLRASRVHGSFVLRGDALYYIDSSTAGTVVDGRHMSRGQEVMIQNGSTVVISAHTIKIQL